MQTEPALSRWCQFFKIGDFRFLSFVVFVHRPDESVEESGHAHKNECEITIKVKGKGRSASRRAARLATFSLCWGWNDFILVSIYGRVACRNRESEGRLAAGYRTPPSHFGIGRSAKLCPALLRRLDATLSSSASAKGLGRSIGVTGGTHCSIFSERPCEITATNFSSCHSFCFSSTPDYPTFEGFFIAPSGCMALIGACGVRLTVCKRWRKPMNRWPAHQTEDVGFNSLPLPTEQCPWNGNLIRKSVPDGTCEGFSSLRRRATINHQFKVIRWGRHSVPKVSLALRNRYRWP